MDENNRSLENQEEIKEVNNADENPTPTPEPVLTH